MSADFVSAVRNLKTGKYFIVLDETPERYRVINPEGQIVNVPAALFEEVESAINIEQNDVAGNYFSSSQMDCYRQYQQDLQRRAEQEKRAESVQKRAENRIHQYHESSRSSSRTKSQSTSRKSPSPTSGRTGIGATWSGAGLVFYRPQIDRLSDRQSFRVIVDGIGEFVMTKNDFQTVFADVILSPQYKADGFFSYRDVPEKALKFLQTK